MPEPIWELLTSDERDILRFLHEDATFDVLLIVDYMSDAELAAVKHLIGLGLVELSGDTFYLTTDGISYMVDREED